MIVYERGIKERLRRPDRAQMSLPVRREAGLQTAGGFANVQT